MELVGHITACTRNIAWPQCSSTQTGTPSCRFMRRTACVQTFQASRMHGICTPAELGTSAGLYLVQQGHGARQQQRLHLQI